MSPVPGGQMMCSDDPSGHLPNAGVWRAGRTLWRRSVCLCCYETRAEVISEDAIRYCCQGQIAHHKVLRYVRCVSEFPMTVTGKPQKFVMRHKMIEELGLKVDETA